MDSPYNSLGELESDDLLSFAYQIASGMVTTIVNVSLHEVHCVSAQEYCNILVGEDKSLKILTLACHVWSLLMMFM